MGAKKGYRLPGLNKALKVVDQLGSQMTAEADADYAVALSALRAGQRGLSKQTRALTRDMLAGQIRQTTSLSKLAKQARAQTKVVAKDQAKTTSRYGSALGQSIAQSYAPARASARGTGKVLTGYAKASKATGGVAQTVAGIAQAGVAAQRQAAKYGLSQALQQRAIIDNQTLAGLTGQLYQQALAYNAQVAMYERQRADALKDAKKAANEAAAAELDKLYDFAPTATYDLNEYLTAPAYAEERDAAESPVTWALEKWATDQGITPEDPRYALMAEVARNIHNGSNATTALDTAIHTLYSQLPGYNKWAASDTLGAGLVLEQDRSIVAKISEFLGGGGTADAVREGLIGAGFSDAQIDAYLGDVQGQMSSAPPEQLAQPEVAGVALAPQGVVDDIELIGWSNGLRQSGMSHQAIYDALKKQDPEKAARLQDLYAQAGYTVS